jgi:hypothetical protein
MAERQITHAAHGHILTNAHVWSPDGRWLVYDVRSEPAGSVFDGDRIERVEVATGRVEVLYTARNGAKCGVATYHPRRECVQFILGPEFPTPEFDYGPDRRQGVRVLTAAPGTITALDARTLAPPFVPGALRGGTHVHVVGADEKICCTYDDYLLTQLGNNQRNVAVLFPRPVSVEKNHPRNHAGSHFSVVVTHTTATPQPNTDEISRAYEAVWFDANRLIFIGDVCADNGLNVPELFMVTLPPDLTKAGADPLAGTATTYPAPPLGTQQLRLTNTTRRPFPGLSGPRFWPQCYEPEQKIAFLHRDELGISQLWLLNLLSGEWWPLTRNAQAIGSAFTWSLCGAWIAHTHAGQVCRTNTRTGITEPLTFASIPPPRPEACVFSPDGTQIAFVRPVQHATGEWWNQIFVANH